MKSEFMKPSLIKSNATKASLKRASPKINVPKGLGLLTHPKKATYSKLYNDKITFGLSTFLKKLFSRY